MFTLITHGELFAPEPRGVQTLLLVGERVARVGPVDEGALQALGLPVRVVDATGCVVVPGFVDPHQHLIGAGGEQGFRSRLPEVSAAELARAGITTAVGCLGTDGITRQLGTLLAKVRQLRDAGLGAFLYTGGFHLPPRTLTGSVMEDLVLIEEVLGVGELAVSDARSSQPSVEALARVVAEAYVGGTLSGKAGVTHFHAGLGKGLLSPLHVMLDRHDTHPEVLHVTHVNRSENLLQDAVRLAMRGAWVDMDTVEEGRLGYWLRRYRELGGPPGRITVSSDAQSRGASPGQLDREFITMVREGLLPLAELLPLFTSNPATVLHLARKGRIAEGLDADVVVRERETLAVRHVFSRGEPRVLDRAWVEPSVAPPAAGPRHKVRAHG